MKFSRIRFAVLAFALSIAAIVALQGIFVASLVVLRMHTGIAAIRVHVLEAFDQGVLSDDQVPRIRILAGGHQFTECVSLNLALDPQPNPWVAALLPRLHFHMVDPCRELHRAAAAGADVTEMTDYSRYWHGYRLLLWPALEHLGVVGLRVVSAMLIALAVGLLYLGLRAAIGFTPALILLGVFALQTDLVRIWQVATHALGMAVILGGAGSFAIAVNRRSFGPGLVVFAAVLGAVFNFFDFLVNPPMMPMLLSFLVLAVMSDRSRNGAASDHADSWWDGDWRSSLTMAALVAGGWFLGYAATWASKWALAIWLADNRAETLALIVDLILFRLHNIEPAPIISRAPIVPTIRMVLKSFQALGTPVLLAVIAAIAIRVRDGGSSFDRRRFYLLISPLLIPLLWFEVLSAHTQQHLNFASRSAAAALAVLLTAVVMATRPAVSVGMLWNGLRDAVLWRRPPHARDS